MRGFVCDTPECGTFVPSQRAGATLSVFVLVDDEGKALPEREAQFCDDCAIDLAVHWPAYVSLKEERSQAHRQIKRNPCQSVWI